MKNEEWLRLNRSLLRKKEWLWQNRSLLKKKNGFGKTEAY